MLKLLGGLLAAGVAFYLLVCGLLYFKQEALLFYPSRLPAAYRFTFPGRYDEVLVRTDDGTRLSGLLFHAAEKPRGLVFFLHGNGGSLANWGRVAPVYTDLGYDVFLLDYRGYGKSGGHLAGQAQLLADVEAAYRQVAAGYPADSIVIAGYSLGTGPAAWLAGRHPGRALLLHASYFSLTDMAAHTVRIWPILPDRLLRYPMPTNEFVRRVRMPIVLFHGDQDAVIPYGSSVRLRPLLKPTDQLITVVGAGHVGLLDEPQYQAALRQILR